MAYVSKEDKKNLTPAIKAVLKKYNMKGTISVSNMSSLNVKLSQGELDILGASKQGAIDSNRYDYFLADDVKRLNYYLEATHIDVNTYWIEEHYKNAKVVAFLTELRTAMEGPDFFNEDDMMTDYAYRSHYVNILVGTWTKPYICTGEEKIFEPVHQMFYEEVAG
jgi:hypothetical protein